MTDEERAFLRAKGEGRIPVECGWAVWQRARAVCVTEPSCDGTIVGCRVSRDRCLFHALNAYHCEPRGVRRERHGRWWFTMFIRLLTAGAHWRDGMGSAFVGEPPEWFAQEDEDMPVMFVQNWSDDPTYVGHAVADECAYGWQPHLETECGLLNTCDEN